jgi:hypothetical protein
MLAEALDAERLGGVVAGGDEVDCGLVGFAHDALGRLAGEEGVDARCDGILEVVVAGTGDDCELLDLLGAGVEDEWCSFGERGYSREEILRLNAFAGEACDEADRLAIVQSEGLERVGAEGLCDQGVVAYLRVSVEGKVVGGEANVRVEEQLQATLHAEIYGLGV